METRRTSASMALDSPSSGNAEKGVVEAFVDLTNNRTPQCNTGIVCHGGAISTKYHHSKGVEPLGSRLCAVYHRPCRLLTTDGGFSDRSRHRRTVCLVHEESCKTGINYYTYVQQNLPLWKSSLAQHVPIPPRDSRPQETTSPESRQLDKKRQASWAVSYAHQARYSVKMIEPTTFLESTSLHTQNARKRCQSRLSIRYLSRPSA